MGWDARHTHIGRFGQEITCRASQQFSILAGIMSMGVNIADSGHKAFMSVAF
jgi:hypothetical protein